MSTFHTGYLAILELRLEATRRPELQALLTDRVRAELDFNIRNYRESQLPGDEDAAVLLYLALNWLILERLTLPGVFDDQRAAELVHTIVERAIPAS
ncbi:hypothetical protein [Nocardia vaccinii]|uniref:hypothetical protein n=1 Tax=Nocardia vaccinii TaxID=1822 RepID=UPI000A7ADEB4|nr:hypothetical protein [Nocardia vaccinii]